MIITKQSIGNNVENVVTSSLRVSQHLSGATEKNPDNLNLYSQLPGWDLNPEHPQMQLLTLEVHYDIYYITS